MHVQPGQDNFIQFISDPEQTAKAEDGLLCLMFVTNLLWKIEHENHLSFVINVACGCRVTVMEEVLDCNTGKSGSVMRVDPALKCGPLSVRPYRHSIVRDGSLVSERMMVVCHENWDQILEQAEHEGTLFGGSARWFTG